MKKQDDFLTKIAITIFASVLFIALILHFVFGYFNHWGKDDVIAVAIIDLFAITISYLAFKEQI